MLTITNYDAIIIGAGQAGVPLSTTLAMAGWKTALIERVHVGGDLRQRRLHAFEDDDRQRTGCLPCEERCRLRRTY